MYLCENPHFEDSVGISMTPSLLLLHVCPRIVTGMSYPSFIFLMKRLCQYPYIERKVDKNLFAVDKGETDCLNPQRDT